MQFHVIESFFHSGCFCFVHLLIPFLNIYGTIDNGYEIIEENL